MKTKTCGAWEGPFKVRGVYEKHLRQCKRKARYYVPEHNNFYCAAHLRKNADCIFDTNPIEIKSGREIDRHILYKFGKIKFAEED